MADYNVDDPNRTKLNWENVTNWLKNTNACGDAVKWVNEKFSDLEKVKINKEKAKETYNMDSSIYALKQFVQDGKYQWADWFIIQIMEEKEYKSYAKFILDQLPIEYDKENKLMIETIEQANNYYKDVIDNNKPSSARKMIEYVERSNALSGTYSNTDELWNKILNYGINLLEKRKTSTKIE